MDVCEKRPKSKRRRVLWLLLLSGACAIGSFWIWWVLDDNSLGKRAARISLGDSRAAVIDIMGAPDVTSARGKAVSLFYGRALMPIWIVKALAFKHLRIGSPMPTRSFPVEIRLTADGRVGSIRRPELK